MRPTRALIHQKNLLVNLELLRSGLPHQTAVCAAVKADAYGHGADAVARILADAGVEAFGVATVEEGRRLRRVGIRQPIHLMGTLQADEVFDAVDAELDLYVWSHRAVQAVVAAANGRRTVQRVHLKVETGMGRGGCPLDQVESLARAIVHSPAIELTGVCTHFASSDGPGPVGVVDQLGLFQQALGALTARGWMPQYIHCANSGGIVSWPESHFNLVRPGIALYGYPPPEGRRSQEFQAVMELVSRVGYVKTVGPGTPLSYGSRYCTSQTTDVATIPLGYADGYRRAFTNRAPLWIKGKRFQVSGTVCMDQFLVDLGPESGVREGDEVILFGPPRETVGTPPPTAADLASLADTISYEILCGISSRVPRILV